MSTIQPTQTDLQDQTRLITWASMGGTDVGSPVAFGEYNDRTVIIQGTFGGATVTLQGSSDGGTTWFTLHDYLGAAISTAAAAMYLIAENPLQIRPSNAAGAGSSITVLMSGTRS